MNRQRDDLFATGDEAQAQRQETIMPIVWAWLGLLTVLGFTIWATFH